MTERRWLTTRSLGIGMDEERRVEIELSASPRRRRLYAVACCRRVWPLLAEERSRRAVEVAERYAEGLASGAELGRAAAEARAALEASGIGHDPAWYDNPAICAAYAAWEATAPDESVRDVIYYECERRAGTAAWAMGIREEDPFSWGDLFGGYLPEHRIAPSCPLSLDPAWLSPTVLSLAQAAYEERALPSGELEPARLAVLADALEEASCADEDILSHLRGSGPHFRGCWALDLILGKR